MVALSGKCLVETNPVFADKQRVILAINGGGEDLETRRIVLFASLHNFDAGAYGVVDAVILEARQMAGAQARQAMPQG